MRLIVYFIFLMLLSGCSQEQNNSFPEHPLHLAITGRSFFSEKIPDSMKTFVPGALQLDSAGNVYVVDEAAMQINVYSDNGRPLRIIGGKGKGPGEFISANGFLIDGNLLYVFDQNLQRMNVFSLGGTSVTNYPFNVAAPLTFKPLDSDQYLVIYSEFHRSSEPREENIAHVYTSDFSKEIEAFLQVAKLDPDLSKVARLLPLLANDVLITGKDEFIFVPFIYNGSLYKFKENDYGHWKHINTFHGYTRLPPFSALDNSLRRQPDVTFSSAFRDKPLKYILHNQSRGLLQYENKIYHFTLCDVGDRRVYGVEIFNTHMQPLGYVPIKSIPIVSEKGNTIGWYAEAIDNNGDVYIRTRGRHKGDNGIRVLSFDWKKGN